jgi:segregation and condensation protein B
LLRFGLKDIHELPSMEEFEKLLAESFQSDLLPSERTNDDEVSPRRSVEEPHSDTTAEEEIETRATSTPE